LNDRLTAGSVHSVQNVTSLDSSKTGSWDEESETGSISTCHRKFKHASSRTAKRADVIDGKVKNEENKEAKMDHRWLYARQLLPVSATFQLKLDDDGTMHFQRSL
jgi:hypothetical protein